MPTVISRSSCVRAICAWRRGIVRAEAERMGTTQRWMTPARSEMQVGVRHRHRGPTTPVQTTRRSTARSTPLSRGNGLCHRHVHPIFARSSPHGLLTTTMSALTASRRLLPRVFHVRQFHSPFVVLNATNHLAAASTAAPMYEKQVDDSPEPHLSSSGTRTYVVSEPDPSNTPYQVPSGAYSTSASYLNSAPTTTPIPEGLHSSTSSSNPYNTRAAAHKEASVGQSAAVRNTAAPGGRTAGV